jgi:hypothetical protein
MEKYKISYAYYKIDKNEKPSSKTSTQKTIQAETEQAAMIILQSQYPQHNIEFRSITLMKS